MLSFYDALAFSIRKKPLFLSFIVSLLLLSFFILIGFSLEKDFQLFTSFKQWLQGSSVGIGKLAIVLADPSFWGIVFQKTLWIVFLFFLSGISFFCLQLVIAKKTLFNQPPHFTASFFLITLGKLVILVSPILFVLYIALREFLKSVFAYIVGYITYTNPTYVFPFSDKGSLLLAVVVLAYFLYTTVLFIERFSFISLLNISLFLKHIKVVGELIFKIILNHLLLAVGLVVLGLVCWKMDSLYVLFFAFIFYLIFMLVCSARWVFILPLLVMILGGSVLGITLGREFFRNYLFNFTLISLVYFCFFFFWSIFWSVLAYLFASTAFVFRFNQTPAHDIKKQAPEKLRRIDELYNAYLTEHKNNTQDNFFHHMEEK